MKGDFILTQRTSASDFCFR